MSFILKDTGHHNSKTIDDLRGIDPQVSLRWERSGPTWPCPAGYSSRQWQRVEASRRAEEGHGACLTPPTTFPVQLQRATEVPEMRETESSKTCCLQGPRAWEPKLRLRHRQARRQRPELENFTTGPSHQSRPPSPVLWTLSPYRAMEANVRAQRLSWALSPLLSSFWSPLVRTASGPLLHCPGLPTLCKSSCLAPMSHPLQLTS